ncbi:MAG TPA: insulinase family protein [Niabella sp.]|jgi:zinc protease|nr:insulinase family protein [Chitinophagaceae bacterium]HRO85483.1 insulinase family protein [Niabella sp.]
MNQRKQFLKGFFFTFFLLGCVTLFAQINLNDKIPVDPKVKIGKLANGLTYYIRENKKPEQKVELRLVVNTGSIMEDDDQQGLAHMAEHMAFNGTKNFKKNEIVSFLQNIGVGFGNDLNAYTSFDETVYMLPIPVDKPENLEKGFQVLEDWAHNVTYLNDDIEGERAIILEESRLGKGADDRMTRQLFPYIFAGSKYANRLPIGLDSIIKTFKPDAIRRFYKEWYRPNLMAVIVVGDVDPAKAEAMIKKHFSGLTNPTNARERTYAQVSPYKTNEGKVVTDKEATNYIISLAYSAFPSVQATTVGEYKNDIVKNIFTTLLNYRLSELTQKENPPFLFGATYFESYARGYDQFNAITAVSDANAAKKGLSALMEEIERAKRFGFTQPELDRAKLNLKAGMEKAFKEKEKTESSRYVGEYLRNFLSNEPIPGIEVENNYYNELIPQITLEDVAGIAKLLQKTPEFFVSLMGPDAKELPLATDLIKVATDMAARTDIEAHEEKAVATKLLSKEPVAGKIVKQTVESRLGTKTWNLSNGTTVTIKKTDFKNDEILLTGRRYGGTSNYGLKDKYNAQNVLSVVNAMGYGDFSPTDLQKALAGKTANAGASLSGTQEGFSGSSSVKDLETMLQLLYLKATSPRVDESLYKSYVQKMKAQLAFMMADPQTAFTDTLYKVLYKNNPLGPGVPRPEDFDKVDMNRALEIYKERIENAYGMNFVIVGSIDEATLKPLVEKYIGGLPSVKKVFNFKDQGVRPVKGVETLNVYKGQADKSMIISMVTGEIPFSDDLSLKASALSEILNIRIIEELREKIQGIYGGSTQVAVSKIPYQNYTAMFVLPTGPDKIDTLLKAMDHEIESIKTQGPSLENLNKVKRQWLESRKTAMKQNSTWLNYILSTKLEKKNVDRFLNYEKYVNALTPKGVQETAQKLFNGKNVFTAILRPEKK